MEMKNQSPVTANAEQATTYSVEENVNLDLMESQGSVTPGSNCNAQSNPTVHVPLDKCLCGTYLSGTRAGTMPVNPNLKEWNGEPLQEDVVYHRNEMLGIPECSIKENREVQSRAAGWRRICRENGMVVPAVYVKAENVKEAGFTPAIYQPDLKSWWIVPDSLLPYYYIRVDGNGRACGHDLDLKEAMNNAGYTPFDFIFVFKEIHDSTLFFRQYISVNLDVKKTTGTELLNYSSCHNTSTGTALYHQLIGEGFVAKAASQYIFGRELTREDILKISNGHPIHVEQPLVQGMQKSLEVYRTVFSGSASNKVLKGVPLARWTCRLLKEADDITAMCGKIENKFSHMTPQFLTRLQDAKGIKGDRTQTVEIILIGIFNEILKD